MPTKLPTLTWAIVATDLFHWKGSDYLLVVDRYIEIARLSTTTSGHQTTNDSLCTTRSTKQSGFRQSMARSMLHWSWLGFPRPMIHPRVHPPN